MYDLIPSKAFFKKRNVLARTIHPEKIYGLPDILNKAFPSHQT